MNLIFEVMFPGSTSRISSSDSDSDCGWGVGARAAALGSEGFEALALALALGPGFRDSAGAVFRLFLSPPILLTRSSCSSFVSPRWCLPRPRPPAGFSSLHATTSSTRSRPRRGSGSNSALTPHSTRRGRGQPIIS